MRKFLWKFRRGERVQISPGLKWATDLKQEEMDFLIVVGHEKHYHEGGRYTLHYRLKTREGKLTKAQEFCLIRRKNEQ